MGNFVNTRKNFPVAQKLSSRQCRSADEVFGTLIWLIIITITKANTMREANTIGWRGCYRASFQDFHSSNPTVSQQCHSLLHKCNSGLCKHLMQQTIKQKTNETTQSNDDHMWEHTDPLKVSLFNCGQFSGLQLVTVLWPPSLAVTKFCVPNICWLLDTSKWQIRIIFIHNINLCLCIHL